MWCNLLYGAPMKKTLALLSILVTAASFSLIAGYLLRAAYHPVPDFHDLRINPVQTYVELIDPDDPAVVELAGRFATFQEAYNFVSDEIAFAPFVPPGPVAETLNHGMGSCLGKAVLLCSLYRAMGLPVEDARVVMGLVVTAEGTADHVWIDMEYEGRCLQQDPSGMLGRFGFYDFPGTSYVQRFVMKETFCFNEAGLAIVSQLNRFRDGNRY